MLIMSDAIAAARQRDAHGVIEIASVWKQTIHPQKLLIVPFLLNASALMSMNALSARIKMDAVGVQIPSRMVVKVCCLFRLTACRPQLARCHVLPIVKIKNAEMMVAMVYAANAQMDSIAIAMENAKGFPRQLEISLVE